MTGWPSWRWSAVADYASGMLYAGCLAAPAIRIIYPGPPPRPEEFYGFMALLMGWGYIPHGEVSWLANPMLVSAWVCNRLSHHKAALALALAAFFLALQFLAGGTFGQIELLPGYYLWLGAILLAAVSGGVGVAASDRERARLAALGARHEN